MDEAAAPGQRSGSIFDPRATLYRRAARRVASGKDVLVTIARARRRAEGPLDRRARPGRDSSRSRPRSGSRHRCDSRPCTHAGRGLPGAVVDDASRSRIGSRTRCVSRRARAADRTPVADHAMYGSSVTLDTLPEDIGVKLTLAIGEGLVDMYGQPYTDRTACSSRPRSRTGASTSARRPGCTCSNPRYQIPQWMVDADAVPSMHVQLSRSSRPITSRTRASRPIRASPCPASARSIASTGSASGSPGEARVDLRPALRPNGTGHVIAIATAGKLREVAWIEVTKLGVVARVDGEHVNAWASDISAANVHDTGPECRARLVLEHGAPTVADLYRRGWSRSGRAAWARDRPEHARARCATHGRDAERRRVRADRSRAQVDPHAHRRVVRRRRSVHVQAGRAALHQGLAALDARRRQPGHRAAGCGRRDLRGHRRARRRAARTARPR